MSILSIQILFSKNHSQLKGAMAPWWNGWFKGWNRESIKLAWDISCQKAEKSSKNDENMSKRQKFKGAPSGPIWDHLSYRINNDSMRLKSTEGNNKPWICTAMNEWINKGEVNILLCSRISTNEYRIHEKLGESHLEITIAKTVLGTSWSYWVNVCWETRIYLESKYSP